MNSELNLIEIVSKATSQLSIKVMLIGAYARDYWITKFNLPKSPRTTYDIDFAIQVLIWEDFDKLLNLLKDNYGLIQDKQYKHKLWLGNEISLDIVPCGGIANNNGIISWPPNFDTSLCVYAYDVAAIDGEIVSFETSNICVIKLYWLALLKLQSYVCNPCDERNRDLQDAIYLIKHYWDCIDLDKRIYASDGIDKDILEKDNFDIEIAGIELIIRDCLRANSSATINILKTIESYNQDNKLVKDLVQATQVNVDFAIKILDKIKFACKL